MTFAEFLATSNGQAFAYAAGGAFVGTTLAAVLVAVQCAWLALLYYVVVHRGCCGLFFRNETGGRPGHVLRGKPAAFVDAVRADYKELAGEP